MIDYFKKLRRGLRSHIKVRSPYEFREERVKKKKLMRFAKNLSGLDVVGKEVLFGTPRIKKKRRW